MYLIISSVLMMNDRYNRGISPVLPIRNDAIRVRVEPGLTQMTIRKYLLKLTAVPI